MPETQLTALIEHLLLEDPGQGLLVKLKCLLQHILKPTASELLDLLDLRCASADEWDVDILENDDAKCLLSKTDQAELERELSEAKRKAKTLRTFGEAVQALRKETAAKSSSQKRVPTKYPTGSITAEQVQKLLPPSGRVHRCKFHSRWQVFIHGHSCSRSWGLWGADAAAKLCVQWAWNRHTDLTGVECPIEGLM
eukprot:6492535-Amphidinium_carterae.4